MAITNTNFVDGQGGTSASQLNALLQTCDTAANLRNFIGTTGQEVGLKGISAPNDGLGGFFYWVLGGPYTDDGLNTIVPNGYTAGAWIRLEIFANGEGVVITAYGAVPNGDSASPTDNAPAIQAAINTGSKIVIVPTGTFMSGPFTLGPGTHLVGQGGTIRVKSGSTSTVLIPSTSADSAVTDLTFNAVDQSTTNSSVIVTANGSGTMTNLLIARNVFNGIPTTSQSVHAIQLSYGEASITENYVDQCGGDEINLNAGNFIVDGNILKNGGDGGIAFNNGATGIATSNYVYKCDLGIGAGPEGATATPGYDLNLSDNRIEACGDGINMGYFGFPGREGPENVTITSNTIVKCKRSGIRDDGNSPTSVGLLAIVGNDVRNGGTTDYDGVAGPGNGIVINNATLSTISGNTIGDGTGVGIQVNSLKCVVTSNVIKSCGGNGIYIQSADCIVGENRVSFPVGDAIRIENIGANVSSNQISDGGSSGINFAAGGGIDCILNDNLIRLCLVGISYADTSYNRTVSIGHNILSGNTTNTVNVLGQSFSPFINLVYSGTTNGSGTFTFAHGLGAEATYTLVLAQAFAKGALGVAEPMAFAYCDGVNASFTSAYNTTPCRAYLNICQTLGAW